MTDHKLWELFYFLAKLIFIYPLHCSLLIPAILPLAEALSVLVIGITVVELLTMAPYEK
jgi:hypothetical protein